MRKLLNITLLGLLMFLPACASINPVPPGYVIANPPESAFSDIRLRGIAMMERLSPQLSVTDADYMKTIAAQHALSHIMPQTYQLYGISIPEGATLAADSVKPILTNVTLDPASFDLRQITCRRAGKYITTPYYTYLVHVKYQTRFSYEVVKDSVRTKHETTETHDMISHHYIFPKQALISLVELLKLQNDSLITFNGDTYANPLKPLAR